MIGKRACPDLPDWMLPGVESLIKVEAEKVLTQGITVFVRCKADICLVEAKSAFERL